MATSIDYGQAAPGHVSRDPTLRSSYASAVLPRVRAAKVDPSRSLTKLIEGQIIPRLIVTHPTPPTIDAASPDLAAEVDTFAPLALQVEADALIEHVETLLARGASIDALLVDLLAPAARRLGEYWEEDRCDFVDVTMGLWRLQEVVHDLAARGPIERRGAGSQSRALFAAMPGDQHGFGAVVVEEMFARAGWITDRVGDRSGSSATSELLERVAVEWFDMVGLTVSCDCNTGAVPSAIAALRSVSRNPRVVVMVGGRVFAANPGLAIELGADGTAGDARGAVLVAQGLMDAVGREVLAGG